MNPEAARVNISASFDEHYYYSNVVPFEYNDFIDGMAWIGLLCGACHLAKDEELIHKTETFLRTLLNVGKDARAFASRRVELNWKTSKIGGLFYREKAQSFAGPAGLFFAIQCGAKLDNPFNIKGTAEFYADWSNFFGYLLRVPWFGKKYMRQHLNSVMLGCLVSKKKPGKSLKWLYESNPFYGYIAKKKMDVECPPDGKYAIEKTIEHKKVQPISKREPSAWFWKQWPTKEHKPSGEPIKRYTPVAYLTAHYLQKFGEL